MMLFAPIGFLGLLALVLVLGLTFVTPLYAIAALLDGRYLPCAITAGLWLVWLRFGKKARHFVFEGFEHAGL
jgi:hypothetical protein